MKIISLNGTWKLTGKSQAQKDGEAVSILAKVPGCVQLDLSRENYLPSDLFMGENILEAEKYESYEWWYEKSFAAPDDKENVFLVFDGVDCLAEYFLNGVRIGESKNALIEHEFRIDECLKDGDNTLTVHIFSAMSYAKGEDYPIRLLFSQHAEGSYLRKAPHSFGWDIMPRAVTAGLWRGVRIEMRDSIYFSQAYVVAGTGEKSFFYTLTSDGYSMDGVEIELDFSCGESSFKKRATVKHGFGIINFNIEHQKLWYPYGYGEANVYDGYARVYRDGKLIHEKKISFGIRDVVLDRRDRDGLDDGQFRFLINGTEIMCKGSNWVPLDAFHCRDAERYEQAMELVRDIGCNLLRCWGGNVYEDHAFFDFCDRNGIMVWQDFAMACAQYPDRDDFNKNLKEEATSVIRKLRNHPSIILWAGDNEIDACFPQYDPNKNEATRSILPKCVRDNDLNRPYLPSSPYISPKMYEAGVRSQVHGSILVEDHLWGPRDYFKSDFYTTNKAHFVSETGYHGCPSLESIKKFITPEKVWPYRNNSEWTLHSSDQNGNDARVMLMENQVRQLFGEVPTDPEEYVLASQISQAEAKKYFIERMRVGRPEKTGIIWWNLLDGWPQMSDAVVDYYFTKKLAYGYIKRSQAPFVIAAGEISSWELPIYACNDTLSEKVGHLLIKDAISEEILYDGSFTAKENASTKIVNLPIYYSEHRVLIFEWDCEGLRGFNHYLCGYPPFSLSFYKSVMKKYNL
ncbi:MAG: glycoside hydrolase family 2 [Clostridia bacterium]|nr:glycoside hydrolase family 2 [Clostridia bacterium]